MCPVPASLRGDSSYHTARDMSLRDIRLEPCMNLAEGREENYFTQEEEPAIIDEIDPDMLRLDEVANEDISKWDRVSHDE